MAEFVATAVSKREQELYSSTGVGEGKWTQITFGAVCMLSIHFCSALQLTLKSYINCTSNFLTYESYTQRRNYLEKTQLNILE